MTASNESRFGFTFGLGPGTGCRPCAGRAEESDLLFDDLVEVDVVLSVVMLVGTKAVKMLISKIFRRSISNYLLVLSYLE
jgi:hypothetical protein